MTFRQTIAILQAGDQCRFWGSAAPQTGRKAFADTSSDGGRRRTYTSGRHWPRRVAGEHTNAVSSGIFGNRRLAQRWVRKTHWPESSRISGWARARRRSTTIKIPCHAGGSNPASGNCINGELTGYTARRGKPVYGKCVIGDALDEYEPETGQPQFTEGAPGSALNHV